MIDLADIKENLSDVLTDYFNNEKFDLKPGSLFVVGCSTSMIRGEWMGTDSAKSIMMILLKAINHSAEAMA